jgi:hypothetical protein
MRASAEDVMHGRCNGIGERVKGVVRRESDGRGGEQGVNHGGSHPGRWGEDRKTNSSLGDEWTWKGRGTRGRK